MKALSVRQPWAWAIIHAGKDVENRSQGALRHMSFVGVKRLAIHASKGMTRAEYEEARDFMTSIDVACPLAAELQRGGVIGTVAVVGVVSNSPSPWFFGPRGVLLKDPQPLEFHAFTGALGLFDWSEWAVKLPPEPPRRWMLRASQAPVEVRDPELEGL